MFGDDCVTFKDRNASVTVDGVTVSVDTQTRVSPPASARSSNITCASSLTSDLVPQAVCSEDESLRDMVEVAVQRLYDALSPSTDTSSGGRSQH